MKSSQVSSSLASLLNQKTFLIGPLAPTTTLDTPLGTSIAPLKDLLLTPLEPPLLMGLEPPVVVTLEVTLMLPAEPVLSRPLPYEAWLRWPLEA